MLNALTNVRFLGAKRTVANRCLPKIENSPSSN